MSATATLADLIAGSFRELSEGSIVKGKILEIKPQVILVDIGYKSEGAIPSNEFEDEDIQVGDEVEVLLERLENDEGMVVLSKEKAAHRQNWEKIYNVFKDGGLVKGKVKSVVKGGLMVNVGVEAFLPGSQIDIIPPKDLNGMDGLLHITDMSWGRLNHPSEMLGIGQKIEVQILEVNREKERVSLGLKQLQNNPWENIEARYPVGQRVRGKVTKLVAYGAFVEVEEGVEGLVHVSELSWTKRIARPSDVLTVGQEIEASVLGINKEERKISLGVRQLEANPWDDIDTRYPIGTQLKRAVRNLTAYGAFVELEEGIDGMIHVSDLSWTRKINHPSELLKKGQEVDAVVLGIDKANQRISLGMKQLDTDPWSIIDTRFKVGDVVKGRVAKIASFGAFVELEDDIDGLVHISQISEDRIEKVKDKLNVGDEVEARVIKVDKVERRIGLSIKAMNYSDADIQKESQAFEALRPSTDLVGLEQAFKFATEEWRPGGQ